MLDRYHTTSIGPDEEALRAAFLKCGDLMKARGCTVMGLAVHTKNNLDGVVRTVFGEDVVRVLDRDNRLDLKGIVIQLITEKIQIRKRFFCLPGSTTCWLKAGSTDRWLFGAALFASAVSMNWCTWESRAKLYLRCDS